MNKRPSIIHINKTILIHSLSYNYIPFYIIQVIDHALGCSFIVTGTVM